jgi:hypothetical protein
MSAPVAASHWYWFLLAHLPNGTWRHLCGINLKHNTFPSHLAVSAAQFSETNLGIDWHPFSTSQ